MVDTQEFARVKALLLEALGGPEPDEWAKIAGEYDDLDHIVEDIIYWSAKKGTSVQQDLSDWVMALTEIEAMGVRRRGGYLQ